MKTPPKKVFIKENGEYVELEYDKFCKMKQFNESFRERKFIPIQGNFLEVDKESYKEFYKDYERQKYLRQLEIANTVYQTEESEGNEGMYRVNIADEEFENRELDRIMLSNLVKAIELLAEGERQLIDLLYCKGLSQRQAAKILQITQPAIKYRLDQLLAKLKGLM